MHPLISAALALTGAAGAAQDNDCPEQPCVAGLSASQLFVLAEREEAAGRFEQAETLLTALTRDPDIEYRSEARFRLGKFKERRGDPRAALTQYRRLLDEKPDAQRVRLEVARLLAITGDEQGARRELRRAQATGLPEDVARVVDQFAIALRSRRTIGGTFEIAVAPDSNINTATRQQTVETVLADIPLGDDARQRSGLGLSLSGQGYSRIRIAGQTVLAQLFGHADLYRQTDLQDMYATLSVGPEFQIGRARVRPAAVATSRRYGGRHYSHSYGATINVMAVTGRTSQLETDLSLIRTDYRLNPLQDGTSVNASMTYDQAVSARFSTRVTATVSRQDAVDPGYATTSFGADLLVVRQFGDRSLFAQAGASRLVGDDRLFLFREVRRDRRLTLTAGVLWRRLQVFGFSPVIRASYTRNRSSLSIYDFERTRAEFALSREL